MRLQVEQLPDEDLVDRICEGDSDAFEVIYRRRYELVYKYARKLLRGPNPDEDAKDIAQITFVTAYKNIRSFRGGAKFRTYLCGIARRLAIKLNQTRIAELDSLCPLPDTEEELHRLLGELELSRQTSSLRELEMTDMLRKAIDSLSETVKPVLVLRYFGDRSYGEIAEILAVDEKIVKSRLHDAKRSLEKFLGNRQSRLWEDKREGRFVVPSIQPASPLSPAKRSEIGYLFKGENVSLEQYMHMAREEKIRLQETAEHKNAVWLQWKFSTLPGVSWMMVVDGEVISCGKPKDYPSDAQLLELIRDKGGGKYPFYFDNPLERVIEESCWHPTSINGDFYPNVPIRLGDLAGEATIQVEADFDTGARSLFVGFEWARDNAIAQPLPADPIKQGIQLGQVYEYSPKRLRLEIVSESGAAKSIETEVCCVFGWQNGPFVKVNSRRLALVGRGVLSDLKPAIHLDFNKQESRVYF
jgi:RNA polymerase sigma-70 factor (ECF subfamily)